MKSTAKMIAFWVVLLVTAVLLYNVFTVRPNSKETTFSFSRFMDEVNNKNVKDVKVVDSDVTGELVSGGTFRTVVPVSSMMRDSRTWLPFPIRGEILIPLDRLAIHVGLQ